MPGSTSYSLAARWHSQLTTAPPVAPPAGALLLEPPPPHRVHHDALHAREVPLAVGVRRRHLGHVAEHLLAVVRIEDLLRHQAEARLEEIERDAGVAVLGPRRLLEGDVAHAEQRQLPRVHDVVVDDVVVIASCWRESRSQVAREALHESEARLGLQLRLKPTTQQFTMTVTLFQTWVEWAAGMVSLGSGLAFLSRLSLWFYLKFLNKHASKLGKAAKEGYDDLPFLLSMLGGDGRALLARCTEHGAADSRPHFTRVRPP